MDSFVSMYLSPLLAIKISFCLECNSSESVRQVSLHIDSIGLEEAIAEQDSAIEAMMSEALSAFEHLRSGDLGRVGSKADPKDGDFHGDPTRPITHEETFGQTASGDERGTAGGAGNGTGPSADATDQAAAESADADGAASIDSQFEDLMKGIDIDEMASACRTIPAQATTWAVSAAGRRH